MKREFTMHALFALFLVLSCDSTPHTGGFPAECPDPEDERVHYVHETWEERLQCPGMDFGCPEGAQKLYHKFDGSSFELECGCGCYDRNGVDTE